MLAACLGPILALADSGNQGPRPLAAREDYRQLGAAEVSVLRDPGGRLGIDEVISAQVAARFVPMASRAIPVYTQDAVWIRVVLRREAAAPSQWTLELTTPLLDDVRFFHPLDGGGHAISQAGDRFAFAERQVPHRRPVFQLDLPDDQPRAFHLRVRSEGAMNILLLVRSMSGYESAAQFDSLWIGALLGLSMLSVVFFLLTWFVNRVRLLLWSALVTVTFAAAASANLGLINALFPLHAAVADAVHPFALALFFPILYWLFGKALRLGSLFPRFARLHLLSALCCSAAAASWPLGLYSMVGGRLMMLGILFGLVWSAIGAWWAWHRARRGLLTAVALTVFLASFALAPAMTLSLLPLSPLLEPFWVVGSVGFILMAQFTVLGGVRVARTRQREAERAAQLAEAKADQELSWRRQQARYFAGVAHDLRTPLSAVRFGLANLERSLGSAAAPSIDRMRRLQVSARRASDMIERHLQLQRMDQPDVELMLQPVPPGQCLELVRGEVVEAWPTLDFRLQVHPDAPALALMDEELVVRALSNLVSNAAKASPEGATVDLTARGDGQGGIGFEVRDRGPGLGDVPLEHHLEMHWLRKSAELHDALHHEVSFGIGLPTVARVAALHQGRVQYQRQDGCTVFSLWLPAPPEPAGPGPASSASAATAAAPAEPAAA